MDEDSEYTKLPTEEKCQHKLWKARVAGYEEAAKLFQQQTDAKSPEFGKYLGLIKKFVLDSNAAAQEKGLAATLAFVENAAVAGKTCGEVMSGLVSKGFSSSRTKTKELAVEITLMYIEIERHELVQDELIKGLDNKNPKIVVVCISILREALKLFGTSVINIKPVLKLIPKQLEDRDKNVRDETKQLTVEIYRWIKDVIRSSLQSLKPLQLSELDAEFNKVASDRAIPTRFLRSQQAKQAKIQEEAVDDNDDDAGDGCVIPEATDPYDLVDPVDILAKLPKDFYEQCEAKKWQDRKTAMELALQLASNLKLENGDYGDLVRALKKIVAKDTNIVVVTIAAKVLSGLAIGLRKKFHAYANSVIQTVLEKFKEKKQTVVVALREAIDASYAATTLESILEDVQSALDNKNPQIKAETAAFITRAFTKMSPVILTKKLLKPLCTSLLKTLNDTDPLVRDNSSEALGTAMKLVSEKIILPFLPDVDALKMAKVKENCEKAVIVAAPAQTKSTKPKAAKITKREVADDVVEEPKPRARAVTAPVKRAGAPVAGARQRPMSAVKPAPRNPSAGGAKKGAKAQAVEPRKEAEFTERELSDEEVQEQAEELLTADVINGLVSSNWKDRLTAIEKFNEIVQAMDKENIPAQVLVKLLNKKPGLKDNNFQVLKLRLDLLTYVAENGQISRCTISACISDLVDKIGDLKNGVASMAAITAFAEATNLDYISQEVLQLAFAQRNPKNHAEAMNWMANAIKEFGFAGMNVKSMVDYTKKSFAATNPAVRSSAINLLCAMYMFMGRNLRTLFEDEKPALLQLIDAELAKVQDSKPPAPVRGPAAKAAAARSASTSSENLLEEDSPVAVDLIPRSDICGQITEALITELDDKNWKIRAEALQKIANILSDAKFISPNIGDLTNALKSRLTDSNKNIAVQALAICVQLGTALGPHCSKHVRSIAPGLLVAIGDNKNNVRAAGLTALNCWLENTNLNSFFECEMMSDSLKTENPFLRIELLGWLSEHMPNAKGLLNSELALCVPHLYTCLEDRNAEVRKKAQDVLLPFMINLGFESMLRASSKLKPASKSTVVAQLEKVRPNLPVKAAPKSKTQSVPTPSSSSPEEAQPRNRIPRSSSKGKIASKIAAPQTNKSGAKKDDDADMTSFVANNLKEGRHQDERNLKVLKWNFTTPREEFYLLLKDQMASANWGKGLITYCFHNDFKLHIKAIDLFAECLNNDTDATIANVDLILKWLALRFFDTNPSVLLKGLEYLQQLFPVLNDCGYKLHDFEASSFIPYIVLKLGDPKDTVRKGVRDIIAQIFHLYPASKVFGHIMQGLTSKNSRQRAECLEVLGFMFQVFGISVCQPSPTIALKEVAKQISDRDNGVRTAALNCIVQVYYQEGEKVYKYVGQLNDKENSLLEERIKRSAKTRPPPATASVAPLSRLDNHNSSVLSTPSSRGSPASHQQVQSPYQQQQDIQPEPQMRSAGRVRSVRPRSTGPLQLQVDDIEEMYGRDQVTEKRLPEPVDVNADEILNLPDIQLPRTRMRPAASAVTLLNSSSEANMALNLVMAQLASQDIPVVVEAFVQVTEVLRQEEKAVLALSNRVDQILLMGAMQYRLAHNKHMADENVCKADVVKLFRCVTLTLTTLFDHPKLARIASRDVIRDLIPHLVTVILDTRLNELAEGPLVVKSINVLVIRILQKSNPTHTMSALIKLLHDCVGSVTASERYIELIMKCLWKMLRLMNLYINELNVDRILLDCHVFLKSYPSSFWKERSSDTPLRTIKTTLYHLVKAKGEDVTKHLGLIPNIQESDLNFYLNKMINLDKGEGAPRHRSNRSSHRVGNLESPEGIHQGGHDIRKNKASPLRHLPRNSHDALAEIFKKIGDKEHTKDGLLELYEFQQIHPEADIEPFLQRSSEFFQNYIRRGLGNIVHEKLSGGSDGKRSSSGAANSEYRLSKEISFSKLTQAMTDDDGSGIKIPAMDATPLDCLEYLKAFAAQLQLDGSKYTDPVYVQQFMAEIKSSGKEDMDCKKNLESDIKQFEELKKLFEKDMGISH